MAKDSQGNDLNATVVPVTGAISLAPYDPANKITSDMIAKTIKTPELPDAYSPQQAAIGLITSDGGPQDARDADDAQEFYQAGYSINGDPKLTTKFTAAEDNDITREITVGPPDENGVYHVQDIISDGKWCAYQEEAWKGGRIYRRAGVVQVTGNDPGQSERGSVKGRELTVLWQPDDMYEGDRYIESVYDPNANATPPSNP
jgi:hypothetical protein